VAEEKKSNRGFASLSPEKRKELASLGGKTAHAKGLAHRFSPAEARIAGRKGGLKAAHNARARNFIINRCLHDWDATECKLCGAPRPEGAA
jgi:general stress protein YciG